MPDFRIIYGNDWEIWDFYRIYLMAYSLKTKSLMMN